ncbi:unnamed protein product (mitochondrion) [Musa textilis]
MKQQRRLTNIPGSAPITQFREIGVKSHSLVGQIHNVREVFK